MRAPFFAFLAVLAAGCDGTPTPPADAGAGTGDTGTEPTFTLSGDLVIDDRASYTFDQSWSFAAIEVRAAFEVYVAWDQHLTDAWGEQRAPDSYDLLTLTKLATDREDVMERLANDDLDAVIAGTWSVPVTGRVEAALSDLPGFDPAAELVEDEAVTWLLALADEAGPRIDVRDGLFLTPRIAQTGFRISIPVAAETTWSVRFGDDALRTDSGQSSYTLTFGDLTVDAYGKPFDLARVDRVFVARFGGVDEADDLGGDVLRLPQVAEGFWTVGTGGFPSVTLDQATSPDGDPFPGFTSDAAWLVGGACTTCLGPAPMFLSVVEVRDP